MDHVADFEFKSDLWRGGRAHGPADSAYLQTVFMTILHLLDVFPTCYFTIEYNNCAQYKKNPPSKFGGHTTSHLGGQGPPVQPTDTGGNVKESLTYCKYVIGRSR